MIVPQVQRRLHTASGAKTAIYWFHFSIVMYILLLFVIVLKCRVGPDILSVTNCHRADRAETALLRAGHNDALAMTGLTDAATRSLCQGRLDVVKQYEASQGMEHYV